MLMYEILDHIGFKAKEANVPLPRVVIEFPDPSSMYGFRSMVDKEMRAYYSEAYQAVSSAMDKTSVTWRGVELVLAVRR